MLKKILHIGSWVLLAMYVVVTMGAVSSEKNKRTASGLKVEVMNAHGNSFINSSDIEQLLSQQGFDFNDVTLNHVATDYIEDTLKTHPWLENVESFKTVNNQIKVRVWQRVPVVRVMCGNQNYYLDKDGNKMPPVVYGAAHVPVVTGYRPTEQMHSELLIIINYINTDRFLKSQIQQLYINAKKEFVMIPRAGKHEILFGGAENVEGKFYKLKKLYKEEFGENGWNRYRVVDLRFNNQVVCTKK